MRHYLFLNNMPIILLKICLKYIFYINLIKKTQNYRSALYLTVSGKSFACRKEPKWHIFIKKAVNITIFTLFYRFLAYFLAFYII